MAAGLGCCEQSRDIEPLGGVSVARDELRERRDEPEQRPLLVVDFAAHEREELRERDAHIRLGFDDEVMAGWFASAGLDVDEIAAVDGARLYRFE